jgi:hypothetical protein
MLDSVFTTFSNLNFDISVWPCVWTEMLVNVTRKRIERYCSISKNFQNTLFQGALKDELLKCYDKEYLSDKENLVILSDYDIKLSMSTLLKAKAKQDQMNCSRSNLYAYEFAYVSKFNYMLHEALNMSHRSRDAYNAYNQKIAPHNAEMDFVFGLPVLAKFNLINNYDDDEIFLNYTDMDYDVSLLMIQYWSNFAKYG